MSGPGSVYAETGESRALATTGPVPPRPAENRSSRAWPPSYDAAKTPASGVAGFRLTGGGGTCDGDGRRHDPGDLPALLRAPRPPADRGRLARPGERPDAAVRQ